MEVNHNGYTITRYRDPEGFYFAIHYKGAYLFSTSTLREARLILDRRDNTTTETETAWQYSY